MDKGKYLSKAEEDVLRRLKNLPHYRKLIFVYLFGSRVNGKPLSGSDLDICCYYDLKKEELAGLSHKIASAFPEKYDVSLFQLLPVHVKANVFKGQLIYHNDKKQVYDIAYQTFQEYRLYRPLYMEVIG